MANQSSYPETPETTAAYKDRFAGYMDTYIGTSNKMPKDLQKGGTNANGQPGIQQQNQPFGKNQSRGGNNQSTQQTAFKRSVKYNNDQMRQSVQSSNK